MEISPSKRGGRQRGQSTLSIRETAGKTLRKEGAEDVKTCPACFGKLFLKKEIADEYDLSITDQTIIPSISLAPEMTYENYGRLQMHLHNKAEFTCPARDSLSSLIASDCNSPEVELCIHVYVIQ